MSKKIIILGAGISGLSCAYFLKKKGYEVCILEKEESAGGVIQTHEENGYICENGPNTVILGKPELRKLIADLNLNEELVLPSAAAKKRYILRNKKLLKIPSSPADFFATKSLSIFGKIRILFEPFVKPLPNDADQTVADFTTRRFGKEVYKNFINPFVAGIYAGDAAKLSTRFGFKLLYELEQDYKSVIKGFMARAKERKKKKEIQTIFSFRNGMKQIIDKLENNFKNDIQYKARVTNIAHFENGYKISFIQNEEEKQILADCVVSTLPAYALSESIFNLCNVTAEKLKQLEYVPIVALHLGYKKEQVGNTSKGFGVLAPGHENTPLLGILFNSRIFNHVAPKGKELFTLMIGGARLPLLTELPDNELLQLAKTEFETIMNVNGKPDFVHFSRWKKAIPQYTMQYKEIYEAIQKFELNNKNFYIAGNCTHGISVPDCVENAWLTSEKIKF
jgi:oxygen-dependent protoporphyrinogen oxidase